MARCLLKFEDAGCPVPGPSPVFDCSVSLKDFARAARLMYVAYACHRKPSVSFRKIFHGVSYCLHPVFGKFGVIPRSNVNLGVGFLGSYVAVRCCEAWSETKKKWCCRKYGKGCEGSSPPAVDPGDGKTWARQKAIHCIRWNLHCFEPYFVILSSVGTLITH